MRMAGVRWRLDHLPTTTKPRRLNTPRAPLRPASFQSLRHSSLVTQLLPGGGVFRTVMAKYAQVGLIRAVSHPWDGKQRCSLRPRGAESFAKGGIVYQ